ncbi:uncharacterized protein LOC111243428 isoform X1 [Varroa destructor]|uniref:Uncharacterized protein n=1 Tax=Varroa destructor TaxID=109461 RepID=A0A7M7IZE5_VARDE|nr:uncharacterized protein LOC111243428 isoform X1 [Varroa destructor]
MPSYDIMAGSRGTLDCKVLSRRENSKDGPEWLLRLDGPKQMACPTFCVARNGPSSVTGPPKSQGLLNNQGYQGQNCSLSCSCDTDSGYEPSPAYFAVERSFEYPPVEDLEEEDLDDVFYDPPSFLSAPSTPRSCAIPIPSTRQSTPSDDTVEDNDDPKPCRPQSCPLRDPGDVVQDDDDDDEADNRNEMRDHFLDFEDDEDYEDVFQDLEDHHSVSTQTEWLFDEEVAAVSRRRATVSNIPDVVPRRPARTLPRRAASLNEADYLNIGRDLRRLSDHWEYGRFQRRVERRQTFIGFVMDAIMANEAPRRPRMPPTHLR